MRTKMIDRSIDNLTFYEGNVERKVFLCPCGKGEIVEEHDNISGFRDHSVMIYCKDCEQKYEIDLSNGYRGWELRKKKIKKTAK